MFPFTIRQLLQPTSESRSREFPLLAPRFSVGYESTQSTSASRLPPPGFSPDQARAYNTRMRYRFRMLLIG
jgi:hypothetical protein